jgi:hypothetical protein
MIIMNAERNVRRSKLTLMARKPVVYVSSTFVDLKDHRAALKVALEKARYDVECMEKYPAFDERPLDRCLADVAHADVYVLILAHRYGFRPKEGNPECKSITELEYDEAGREAELDAGRARTRQNTPDWNWPFPWDFARYLKEKRRGRPLRRYRPNPGLGDSTNASRQAIPRIQ